MELLKDIKELMDLILDHDCHNISDKKFAKEVKYKITLISSSFIGSTEAINKALKINEPEIIKPYDNTKSAFYCPELNGES